MLIPKIILSGLYFLLLYIAALTSGIKHNDDDDIFGISGEQWKALLIMWAPSLILFIER